MTTPLRRPVLPEAPVTPDRPGFPLLAALAPVAASAVIFAVTSSPFAVVFAFLGPVIAVASFADGAIRARRSGRASRRRFAADVVVARELIDAWQLDELRELDFAEPAIRELISGVDTDAQRWPDERDDPVSIAIGRGKVASGLGFDSPRSSQLSERTDIDRELDDLADHAKWIDEAPVVVEAAGGIVIRGTGPGSTAIARAMVVRLARRLTPRDVEIRASTRRGWEWLQLLPHRVSHQVAGATDDGPESVDFVRSGASLARVELDPRGLSRSRARATVKLGEPGGAIVEIGSKRTPLVPDYCAGSEAASYAVELARCAHRERLLPTGATLPNAVEFAQLENALVDSPGPATLACAIGVSARGEWNVDLVTEGPHAIVGGTTGSGKSELLVSWVLALATRYSPSEVTVLLVDFKGGAAFAQVSALAHSVGVVSDLDARSARRAIESLRAEIRYRERRLLAADARSIEDLSVEWRMARLVVFVDEFAALAQDFPDLREVFVDLASRGRSLGVHLVLCTQRPADVVRDAILANVTLRISLRVADRAQSTAILGTPAAATIGRTEVGRAVVSLGGEEPESVQVALATPHDVAQAVARWRESPPPRKPWCDDLPHDLRPGHPLVSARTDAFAVADYPSEQRQAPVDWVPTRDGHVLVQGARRSGRSTAIRALTRSRGDAVTVNIDGEIEQSWDAIVAVVAALTDERPRATAPRIVALDDLDLLLARIGPEHEQSLVDLLIRLVRDGPARGVYVVLGLQRVTSALTSLISWCESRLLLRMSSRQEHLLAQGRSDDWHDRLQAGAGWWNGDRVQVVHHSDQSGVLPAGLRHDGMPHEASATPLIIPVESVMARALHVPVAVVSALPAIRVGGFTVGREVVDLRAVTSTRSSLEAVDSNVVVVGDPESWQAHSAAMGAVRARGVVIFHGCSVGQFRSLTRSTQHPPPLAAGADRAWVLRPDGHVDRCSFTPGTALADGVRRTPR